MSHSIDLNCDLGEQEGAGGATLDAELLKCVTSANVACGGHAGNEQSMARVAAAALRCGVALGAHPSYPDLVNFGRTPQELDPAALEAALIDQLQSLRRIVLELGGRLRHVKPHGALYHAAMRDNATAHVVAQAVARIDPRLTLVGLAGAPALPQWQALGFSTAAEAFVDRRYEPDGALRARTAADAMILDPDVAADQSVRIALRRGALTTAGRVVPLQAETLCVHSDTPNAIGIAWAARRSLLAAGVTLEPMRPQGNP